MMSVRKIASTMKAYSRKRSGSVVGDASLKKSCYIFNIYIIHTYKTVQIRSQAVRRLCEPYACSFTNFLKAWRDPYVRFLTPSVNLWQQQGNS